MKKIVEAGFPRGRITCLNNAIDMTGLKIWREILRCERSILLKELGLSGTQLAVFLGGLALEKRLLFYLLPWRVEAPSSRIRTPDHRRWIATWNCEGFCRLAILVPLGRRQAMVATSALCDARAGYAEPGWSIEYSRQLCFWHPSSDYGLRIHSPEIAYLESGRNGLMVAITCGNIRMRHWNSWLIAVTEELAKTVPGMQTNILGKNGGQFHHGIMQVLKITLSKSRGNILP